MSLSVRCYALAGFICVTALIPLRLFALEVGQDVTTLTIKDADDKPTPIPDIGEKVVGIIYADKNGSDINDALSDAITAKNFDKSKYRGMGIANLKDTFAPDWVIRMIIRKKIEKYHATILADDDYSIPTKWNLGSCKGENIFILIGKDKKVKYFQRGLVPSQEIPKILELIENEMKK